MLEDYLKYEFMIYDYSTSISQVLLAVFNWIIDGEVLYYVFLIL